MGSSAHSSSTKRSARRRTLQRLLPLGGSEQARAIRWASCSPSSLLGLVALGLRWTSAASNPSQANLWRTRATVERLISRASAILVAGQEEASLGASSPSSALSRMRAWVNWRAGAWPPAIKPSSLPRSSLDKLTGLFLFLGIERPPHVRCRAAARTSGGTHHTREGILLQTNHVRTLSFQFSWQLLTDHSGETRSASGRGPRGGVPTLLASPWTFQRPGNATRRWRPVSARTPGGPRTGPCTRNP